MPAGGDSHSLYVRPIVPIESDSHTVWHLHWYTLTKALMTGSARPWDKKASGRWAALGTQAYI